MNRSERIAIFLCYHCYHSSKLMKKKLDGLAQSEPVSLDWYICYGAFVSRADLGSLHYQYGILLAISILMCDLL